MLYYAIHGMVGDYTSLCSWSETHIASKGLPQLCIHVLKIYAETQYATFNASASIKLMDVSVCGEEEENVIQHAASANTIAGVVLVYCWVWAGMSSNHRTPLVMIEGTLTA